jgi:hypothetical protein
MERVIGVEPTTLCLASMDGEKRPAHANLSVSLTNLQSTKSFCIIGG